jgi:DnaJ-class molecular chaperone
VAKSERAEPLHFELILTPREAARGIVVPFEVPALALCRECFGSGRTMSEACEACNGEGRFVEPRVVEVEVPPGVRDRTRIAVSLEPLGVENLWLRVQVRVAEH